MKLELNNISKTINNTKILDDITISIQSGEIAVLLGKSGAGKTTILRILNELEKYDSGNILLNNIPIVTYEKNQIGMVFQNFNLFSNLSVIENITLGLIHVKKMSKTAAQEIAINILKKYNLIEKKDSAIQSLSGGQKQRIAIIRTLVMEPKIICFDEPISSLDPFSTKEILSFISELQKDNFIIIMTTHNVSILNQLKCTIHLLENGIITQSIKNNDLFAANNENKNSSLYKFIHGII